jgi:hypothetical protein
MPLVQTRGAASAQGFGEFAQSGQVNYIEDVFSCFLYTGNGSTQTITNGIDLAGKGGLVWCKSRSATGNNGLTDTVRGTGNSSTTSGELYTNTTTAPGTTPGMRYSDVTSFNSNGFGLSYVTSTENENGITYVSWTFREQAKFFDIVTYTGTGSNTTIAHNLGSVPGCIIIKSTSTAGDWYIYHQSLGNTQVLNFNTDPAFTGATYWNNTTPTSTVFSVGTGAPNQSGETYVAYIFAHNAGGFGLTGTDNVISCGSFTTSAGGVATITLGYEPQFVMIKRTDSTGDWIMLDQMRGFDVLGLDATLLANSSAAETANQERGEPTATGFYIPSNYGNNATYIYIAIRRGPMEVPTVGTSVFSPIASAAAGGTQLTTNFPVDLQMYGIRAGDAANITTSDRLRGVSTTSTAGGNFIVTSSTAAETGGSYTRQWGNTGFVMPAGIGSQDGIFWNFQRAPSFMDVVCYTGTGSNTTQTHNLGVVPELIIVKRRDTAADWDSYSSALANTEYLVVNTNAAKDTGATRWNSTTPTASVFSIGTSTTTNASAGTYVAYLFATCAGVSKVGSYTGTATTLQINCGFTAGSRFVLIKRTDFVGPWYVWDSARGIVAGDDPYLIISSTAAEVTNTDYVDTYNAGFEITSTAPNSINANGGTFIFLAIA